MQDCKVNILGTEYTIQKRKYSEEPAFKKRSIDGYCDRYQKLIVYCDLDTYEVWNDEPEETRRESEKCTLRHEIVHAFIFESGLSESSHGIEQGWAIDEEIVDWIATQTSKIYKACESIGAI